MAVALAIPLCLSGVSTAGPAGKAGKPVVVEDLKRGLMTALGPAFEYLGGEVGNAKARVGALGAERFFFATVRARTPGEFALAYTVAFDLPAAAGNAPPRPDKGVYVIPLKIGERDHPRVLRPKGWGGSAYPHANVGDTLLIPIRVDRFCTGHTFARLDPRGKEATAFFSVAAATQHERLLKLAAAKPVVVNEAAEQLDLLGSWSSSAVARSLKWANYSLSAYLQFKKPGEFNLATRLAKGKPNAVDAGVSFRVVPKNRPVTVCLEHFDYTEHTGQRTVRGSATLDPGTLEVRVGDRVSLNCGGYKGPVREPGESGQQGLVVVQPFTSIQPYTPDPKK
jgi:hypothetical protein